MVKRPGTDINIVFLTFIQASRAFLKYYDACLYDRKRLSVIQFAVLGVLSLNNGMLSPSQIAEITYTEKNNITTLVRRMVRAGLVITKRSPSDKRVVNVILTRKGQDLYEEARSIPNEVRDYIVNSIESNELFGMLKPLETVRDRALVGIEQINSKRKRLRRKYKESLP